MNYIQSAISTHDQWFLERLINTRQLFLSYIFYEKSIDMHASEFMQTGRVLHMRKTIHLTCMFIPPLPA